MKTHVATQTWRDVSYHQLALCLLRNGQSEVFRELVAEGDRSDDPFYLSLHSALEGNLFGALEGLRPLASQSHPQAQRLLFRLLIHQAKIHFHQQDYEALSPVLDEALRVMPDHPAAMEELRDFQAILPYCYLKIGKRSAAENLWHQDVWMQGGPAIHKMAILYYQWAIHAEEQLAHKGEGSPEELDNLWRKAIAFWVALANSDNFWMEWSRGRSKYYEDESKAKELASLKKYILEDLLPSRFRHFFDRYTDLSQESGANRHRRYQSLLRREKQATSTWQKLLPLLDKAKQTVGFDLTQKVPLEAAVRALQQSEGVAPCFRGPDQERCPRCSWEVLCRCFEQGVEPVLHLEFFGGPLMGEALGLSHFVRRLLEIQASGTVLDEDVEKMADYLSPLGLAMVLLEERLPEQALQELAHLEPSLRSSPASQGLEASAWTEQGRRLETHDLKRALEAWEKANRIIKELKKINAPRILRRLTQLEADLGTMVAESCIREARGLQQAERIAEAIVLLKRGLEIASTEDLKVQLADLYVINGHAHLKENQFQAARQEFQKALDVKPGYSKAKQGMSTAFNNEGVIHHDAGRLDEAVRLQRQGLEFDSNNHVCRKNLAGSLNAKGVKKIDVEVPRAYSQSQKMALAFEALELFKQAHEIDPSNQTVIDNHNRLLEILRDIRW